MITKLRDLILIFKENHDGAILIWFILMFFPIIMMVGAGSDYMAFLAAQSKTKSFADSSVLASLKNEIINQNKPNSVIVTQAESTMITFFYSLITASNLKITVTISKAKTEKKSYSSESTLCYTGVFETNMMKMMGINSLKFSDCVNATSNSGELENYYDFYFIVDASTSMGFGATNEDQKKIMNSATIQNLSQAAVRNQADASRGTIAEYQYDLYNSDVRNTYSTGVEPPNYKPYIPMKDGCAHVCHVNNIPDVAIKEGIKTRLDVSKDALRQFILSINDDNFTKKKVKFTIIRFSSAGMRITIAGKKNMLDVEETTKRVISASSDKSKILDAINDIQLDSEKTKSGVTGNLLGGGGTNYIGSFEYINNSFMKFTAPSNPSGASEADPIKYVYLITDGTSNSKNVFLGFSLSGIESGGLSYYYQINNADVYSGSTLNGFRNEQNIRAPSDLTSYNLFWAYNPSKDKNYAINYYKGSNTARLSVMHSQLCESFRTKGKFYVMRLKAVIAETDSHWSVPLKENLLGNVFEDSASASHLIANGVRECAGSSENVLFVDGQSTLNAHLQNAVVYKYMPKLNY